jgi:hypothetical protein
LETSSLQYGKQSFYLFFSVRGTTGRIATAGLYFAGSIAFGVASDRLTRKGYWRS